VTRAVLLFLLLALPAHAQIYKWVDEKGRVQYGEKPPAGSKAAPIRQEAMPVEKPRAPKNLTEQETDFRRRQIEQQQAEEARAKEEKQRQAQCESARGRLAAGESAGRHSAMKGGERVFLTDAERDQQIARMREQVRQACR
jgi:hypothetical protein